MPEVVTTPDEQVFPPRFWWLKRVTVVMLLLGGALAGLRYVALHIAKRRLEAAIAAITASGEPFEAIELLEKPVPAEEDAGPDVIAAWQLFVVPRQHLMAWNNISPALGYQPSNAAAVSAVLDANQPALAKVRSARGKRVANLGLALQASAVPYQRLWELRQVSAALSLAAQKAHAEGKDAEAVEYLRDGIALPRALKSQPVMLTQLMANQYENNIVQAAKNMAPTLRIDAGNGSASEVQMRALMADLLEDRERPRSGRKWAWLREREMQMARVRALAGDPDEYPELKLQTSWFARWWKRPIAVSTAHDLLVMANTYVAAAGAADAVEAGKIWKEWENHSPELKGLASPVIGNLDSQFQAVYYRREAAVALAARMFQLKHGRDPKNADELAPEFLSAAPPDPLLGNGAKMRVHPTTQPSNR